MDNTLLYGAEATLPAPRRWGQLIFEVGELVGGNFEIRRLLGEGGMGQVLEAHDRALNRVVAIKAAWPDPRLPPLRNEARALAAIRHNSLPTVHGLGSWLGIDYLVMERVFGLNLKQHLNQRRDAGEAFPIAEIVTILSSLAEALRAVHDAGVIHRDIKPANVMLSPPSRVVLMDFGVFAPGYEKAAAAGTPEYMPPEALEGRMKPGAGHLADLYSLGVLAFELATGERPFAGADPFAVRAEQLRHEAPRIDELRAGAPAWLANLVAQLLAADAEARPQSADEVVWRLRQPDGHPLRILVVDDHPDTGEVLRVGISHCVPSAEVMVARSGHEALSLAQHHRPDVMTVDLEMPGMNGLELCMAAAGHPALSRCTLVVVTGKGQSADLRVLAQLGVRHVVRKTPGFVARVAAVVAELSARHAALK
jgi:serine/threonine-protein kinase